MFYCSHYKAVGCQVSTVSRQVGAVAADAVSDDHHWKLVLRLEQWSEPYSRQVVVSCNTGIWLVYSDLTAP